MKIKNEHYNHMKSEIEKLFQNNLSNIDNHRSVLETDNRVKDIKKRMRWDLLNATNLTTFVCRELYQYLDDTHIDTALRNIMKELNAKYRRDF